VALSRVQRRAFAAVFCTLVARYRRNGTLVECETRAAHPLGSGTDSIGRKENFAPAGCGWNAPKPSALPWARMSGVDPAPLCLYRFH